MLMSFAPGFLTGSISFIMPIIKWLAETPAGKKEISELRYNAAAQVRVMGQPSARNTKKPDLFRGPVFLLWMRKPGTDEARKALPGACAPPHKGRGRGPLSGRSRSGRARQWEWPEWSEAERSPPGVPSLPLENTKKTDPLRSAFILIRWEKLTAPPEDEAAEHR